MLSGELTKVRIAPVLIDDCDMPIRFCSHPLCTRAELEHFEYMVPSQVIDPLAPKGAPPIAQEFGLCNFHYYHRPRTFAHALRIDSLDISIAPMETIEGIDAPAQPAQELNANRSNVATMDRPQPMREKCARAGCDAPTLGVQSPFCETHHNAYAEHVNAIEDAIELCETCGRAAGDCHCTGEFAEQPATPAPASPAPAPAIAPVVHPERITVLGRTYTLRVALSSRNVPYTLQGVKGGIYPVVRSQLPNQSHLLYAQSKYPLFDDVAFTDRDSNGEPCAFQIWNGRSPESIARTHAREMDSDAQREIDRRSAIANAQPARKHCAFGAGATICANDAQNGSPYCSYHLSEQAKRINGTTQAIIKRATRTPTRTPRSTPNATNREFPTAPSPDSDLPF